MSLRHLGPAVPNYPFADKGDVTHIVMSQPYEVPCAEYVPMALNDPRVFAVNGVNKTLYHIGDTRSAGSDEKFQRFTRRWANKPAARDEFMTYLYLFPGIGATQDEFDSDLKVRIRNGFTKKVIAKFTYTYFRIASSGGDHSTPDDIPLDPIQTYRKDGAINTDMSPAEIYLSDEDVLFLPAVGGFNHLLTVPTRTEYFALGDYGIVADCTLNRYVGPFYVRRTCRVTPI